MKNIPERVEKEIIQLAKQYDIQKVILFGSRARGDNWERSDIDLAVSGGDIPRFALDLDEEVWTLLLFDVVNLDEPVQPALLKEIARDGVLIYEKYENFAVSGSGSGVTGCNRVRVWFFARGDVGIAPYSLIDFYQQKSPGGANRRLLPP